MNEYSSGIFQRIKFRLIVDWLSKGETLCVWQSCVCFPAIWNAGVRRRKLRCEFIQTWLRTAASLLASLMDRTKLGFWSASGFARLSLCAEFLHLESSQEEDSGLAWRRRLRTQEWLRTSQTCLMQTYIAWKVGLQTCIPVSSHHYQFKSYIVYEIRPLLMIWGE